MKFSRILSNYKSQKYVIRKFEGTQCLVYYLLHLTTAEETTESVEVPHFKWFSIAKIEFWWTALNFNRGIRHAPPTYATNAVSVQ